MFLQLLCIELQRLKLSSKRSKELTSGSCVACFDGTALILSIWKYISCCDHVIVWCKKPMSSLVNQTWCSMAWCHGLNSLLSMWKKNYFAVTLWLYSVKITALYCKLGSQNKLCISCSKSHRPFWLSCLQFAPHPANSGFFFFFAFIFNVNHLLSIPTDIRLFLWNLGT